MKTSAAAFEFTQHAFRVRKNHAVAAGPTFLVTRGDVCKLSVFYCSTSEHAPVPEAAIGPPSMQKVTNRFFAAANGDGGD
jgi:hypothetical protein